MTKNFIEILKDEKAKGNGVVFRGISSKVGLNGNLVLNALVLKSDELKKDTFPISRKDLVEASQPMTFCKLDTALKNLKKAGFISVNKNLNEFPARIYYTLHKDVIAQSLD